MGVSWSRLTDGRPNPTHLQAEAPSEVPSPSTPDRDADVHYAEPALAPSNAFQRYQKSEAEAAAHTPEEGGEAPAAPAAEAEQKRRKRDSGSAPGDSHRSRKRRAHAASQMQGTEAQGLPTHAEAEGQASGPPSTPALSAAKDGGQAQKSAATPAAQTPKSTGRKSKGWQYMGPDLKCAGVSQVEWVHCPDGRSYPRSMTYNEGDLLVEDYLDKTDDDQLYEVEAIVDERRRGKVREFRVKWKGFEMNPEEFISYSNLKECAALDKWEAKLGILRPSEL